MAPGSSGLASAGLKSAVTHDCSIAGKALLVEVGLVHPCVSPCVLLVYDGTAGFSAHAPSFVACSMIMQLDASTRLGEMLDRADTVNKIKT